MNTFLAAQSSSADGKNAVRECLETLGELPPEAALGFLYATDACAAELGELVASLAQKTAVPHWVGTVGGGICSTGREHYDTPSVVMMITDLAPDRFCILPNIEKDCADFLARNKEWITRHGSFFSIVHGDPRNQRMPDLIEQLAGELEGGFLVGGLTASEGEFPQIADSVGSGGLSGVLFSGDVPVITGLTQGCSPIGRRHTVTACQRNILITLDDRPALEVFKEDIGELLARDLNRVAGYIFAGLPLPAHDTGDYLVRNLIGIDPDSQLIAINEAVQTGDPLLFCRRDEPSARQDLKRMLNDLRRRAGDRTLKGGVYYSCLGRGRHLFGEDSEELKIIQQELGDFPLVGFFGNGEISHNRLYAYTGVLTLFL